MRTTVDLPDDLHELARQLAHDSGRSMSEVVVALARAGLQSPASAETTTSRRGVPVVRVGRPVTVEDVRSLDDE
jgi:phosphoglycolate phosphatase-like HAD superfamily hydrolase